MGVIPHGTDRALDRLCVACLWWTECGIQSSQWLPNQALDTLICDETWTANVTCDCGFTASETRGQERRRDRWREEKREKGMRERESAACDERGDSAEVGQSARECRLSQIGRLPPANRGKDGMRETQREWRGKKDWEKSERKEEEGRGDVEMRGINSKSLNRSLKSQRSKC